MLVKLGEELKAELGAVLKAELGAKLRVEQNPVFKAELKAELKAVFVTNSVNKWHWDAASGEADAISSPIIRESKAEGRRKRRHWFTGGFICPLQVTCRLQAVCKLSANGL